MSHSRNLSGCQIFHPAHLPDEWDCVPLKERLELYYGRALKEEMRHPGDVVVYGSNGTVGTHNEHWLDGPGVLVGRKGTVGAVHFTENSFWPIDTVYYVKPVNGDHLHYLYYLLDYLPLKILNAATGVPGLSRRDAYALRGAFPDTDEQAAIARILDAVDTAIELASVATAEAKNLRSALHQRFFFDALGETAYADRPTKRLPTGWKLVPADTLLAGDPKNGVSPKASTQPPGTPTFSIAAVRDGRVDLDDRANLKYAQVPEKAANKFRISRGDVLIVRGNANPDLVGKAGMIDRFPDGCIYPDITKRVVFRKDGDCTVIPEYAVLTWNHSVVHNQVLRRAKTSNGTLKINNRDVKQIVMPVPPPDQQSEIVRLTSAVESKIDTLGNVIRAQQALKKSLMHDLLTGRVRVNGVKLEAVETT